MGKKIHNRSLSRNKFRVYMESLSPCSVGMEACGSSHYWSRELKSMGHEVKLINPRIIKAVVIRNKNDANDAEAIADATRSNKVCSIAFKTLEQQHITPRTKSDSKKAYAVSKSYT